VLIVLQQWKQVLPTHPWIGHALEIAALILGAWLFRALAIGQLRRFTRRTRTPLDDALVDILDRAIKPTLVFAIIAASMNLLPLPVRFMSLQTGS
jgi:hypothetical protein